MSQRAKVLVKECKDPKKKKDLGTIRYIKTILIQIRKVRTKMEIIVTLATKFLQWSILIAVVIITFLINLLDKKKKMI